MVPSNRTRFIIHPPGGICKRPNFFPRLISNRSANLTKLGRLRDLADLPMFHAAAAEAWPPVQAGQRVRATGHRTVVVAVQGLTSLPKLPPLSRRPRLPNPPGWSSTGAFQILSHPWLLSEVKTNGLPSLPRHYSTSMGRLANHTVPPDQSRSISGFISRRPCASIPLPGWPGTSWNLSVWRRWS